MEVTDVQYKESEIGVIPVDWNVKKISDFSKPVRGGSPRPAGSPLYFNGDYIPWLTVAALTNISSSQLFVSETEGFLTQLGSEYSRTLEKDTLIIANSGATLGVAKLLAIKCCANDGIAALNNFSREVDKAYVVYYINSITQKLREVVATGNGQPNLNTTLIGELRIPLPSTKSEQTAIATALSDTDALIENLEKLIAKKRNIKQGVMQELLTGRKRLEGFSTEWRYSTLSKFVADKKFAIVDGPFGSQMKVQDFVEQGIPIVEMEHLKNKFLEPDKLDRYITHKKFEELIRSSVFPDDIIISKTGSLGYISIVPSSIEKALITSRLAKITRDKKKANISFVFQCLARLREIEYWQRTAQGGTMLILSIANISHAPIPDISIYEQKEIADILDTMDNDIERLEQILNKYNMIKQGMMQALLTGKIRLV
jgi:type I restriction enzyme S subunit